MPERVLPILAALLLAIVLAIGVAGCGDEGSGSGGATSATTAGEGDPSGEADARDRRPDRDGTKESGSRTGTSPESAAPASPERAAELFLVSRDAGLVCDEVLSSRLLKATYGDRSGCVAGRRPATLARDPGLGEPRVDGDRARLAAKPRGGLYDGQELTFTIAAADDGWRIERISSSVRVGP